MSKSVEYKGVLLMQGSYAYELFFDKEDKDHKKLDKHMKELNQKEYDLKERYATVLVNSQT